MSTLSAEVFVFGKDIDLDFDKRFFPNWKEAKDALHENAILVFHWESLEDRKYEIIKFLRKKNHRVLHFVPASLKAQFFSNLNGLPAMHFLDDWDKEKIEQSCSQVMQEFRQKSQENDLADLLQKQLDEIDLKTKDLEQKIKEQEKTLHLWQNKRERQKKRTEASQRILMASLQAENLMELEEKVLKSLAPIYEITSVRILVGKENLLNLKEIDEKSLKVPIVLDQATTAAIFYQKDSAFKVYERNYLHEISEVIAIAVNRWLFARDLNAWQASWKNTFSAMDSKIAIIDEKYNLINSNSESLRGKCYKVLFAKEEVCDGCRLGKDFQIHSFNSKKDQREFYDVNGQSLEEELNQNLYVHFYYPATEKVLFERSKLESEKFIEMGVVGSSIAHDLNNPLSGILSYLQILKSEVKKDTETYQTLEDMWEAAKKCESIIKNLLSFSQKEEAFVPESISLKNTVEKALQLLQADFDKEGIQINKDKLQDSEVIISENALIQVLVETFRNATEELASLEEKKKEKWIEVECRNHDDEIEISIIDNGRGISDDQIRKVFSPMYTTKNPSFHRGLGLTTAYHILQQQGGNIEILPNQPEGSRVKITLTRKKRTS